MYVEFAFPLRASLDTPSFVLARFDRTQHFTFTARETARDSLAYIAVSPSLQFDKLPAGDWDPSKIAQGNVRLTAGGTGSGLRIWNVTYAFPAVRLPRGGTHALGNFPEGRGLGIQFTDGAHTNVSVAFGYVVNGQLSTGFYFAGFSRDGRSVARFTGRLAGGWANVTSGAIAADSVSVFIDEGAPSGLTLIGYAEYND